MEGRAVHLAQANLSLPLPKVCHPVQADLEALDFAPAGCQLTFAEIAAWAQLTARPVSPWTAQMLASLSRAFVAGRDAPTPPFAPIETKQALLQAKLATT